MTEQHIPEEGREALRREQENFRTAVERQGKRRRRFRRTGDRGFWFGLASFGMVGWSIAVPTLLGVALGLWLDARLGGGTRYTLSLLVAGLAVGVANVWRWIQLQAAETEAEVAAELDDQRGDDGSTVPETSGDAAVVEKGGASTGTETRSGL